MLACHCLRVIFNELAATKADCSIVSRVTVSQPKCCTWARHETTALAQLARTFCACVKGNSSPYKMWWLVCIGYSKEGNQKTRDCGCKTAVEIKQRRPIVFTPLLIIQPLLIKNTSDDKKLKVALTNRKREKNKEKTALNAWNHVTGSRGFLFLPFSLS